MSQIKQLILLHQQGKGRKTIARTLGISKTTVKTYLEKLDYLTTDKFSYADLIKLEAPVLEAKFHPGNPAYKDTRFDHFKANLAYYIKELKLTGVNKRTLWEEYKGKPTGWVQLFAILFPFATASGGLQTLHGP